jgi:hypothetical protein
MVRLVQIVPRSALRNTEKKIIPPPAPQTHDLGNSTLVNILMRQRDTAGELWPSNIRIEPVVKKEAFKRVQSNIRVRLKRLLKER